MVSGKKVHRSFSTVLLSSQERWNLPVSSCSGIWITKDRELKPKLGLRSIEGNENCSSTGQTRLIQWQWEMMFGQPKFKFKITSRCISSFLKNLHIVKMTHVQIINFFLRRDKHFYRKQICLESSTYKRRKLSETKVLFPTTEWEVKGMTWTHITWPPFWIWYKAGRA